MANMTDFRNKIENIASRQSILLNKLTSKYENLLSEKESRIAEQDNIISQQNQIINQLLAEITH